MSKYCTLADSGLISFTGDDAQTFLHSQLTCDVAALEVNRSVYGSYCTPKGRILATFLLWRTENGFYMQLPASLRDPIQKRLTMYVLRAKAKVENAGLHRQAVGLFGEDAASHVARVLGAAPQNDHDVVSTAETMTIRLPTNRFMVLIADSAQATADLLKSNAEVVAPVRWAWLDIRSGIPTVTPPTQEQFVPQMVNLDLIGGLSFSKGCYPGQEIVARTHYLGRLKQRTYLAHLASGEPQPGDKLYSAALGDQASGMIVNAAPAPDSGFDVLAAIQISAAQDGAVHWKAPDGPKLKLLPLPYQVTSDSLLVTRSDV